MRFPLPTSWSCADLVAVEGEVEVEGLGGRTGGGGLEEERRRFLGGIGGEERGWVASRDRCFGVSGTLKGAGDDPRWGLRAGRRFRSSWVSAERCETEINRSVNLPMARERTGLRIREGIETALVRLSLQCDLARLEDSSVFSGRGGTHSGELSCGKCGCLARGHLRQGDVNRPFRARAQNQLVEEQKKLRDEMEGG